MMSRKHLPGKAPIYERKGKMRQMIAGEIPHKACIMPHALKHSSVDIVLSFVPIAVIPNRRVAFLLG